MIKIVKIKSPEPRKVRDFVVICESAELLDKHSCDVRLTVNDPTTFVEG